MPNRTYQENKDRVIRLAKRLCPFVEVKFVKKLVHPFAIAEAYHYRLLIKIHAIRFKKSMNSHRPSEIIFHEIGHFYTGLSGSRVLNEYNAQKWGVEKAIEIGYYKVAEEMLNTFEIGWEKAPYHSAKRMYKMASRMAVKDGTIKKLRTKLTKARNAYKGQTKIKKNGQKG